MFFKKNLNKNLASVKYRRTRRADLFSTGEREWSNREGFFIPFETSVWLLNVLWLASFSRIWSAWVFERKASSGASCDASRAHADTFDEDNLPFVEQGHHQNLWFCRVCWLVEQIPSHVWQLVTITCSAGHLAALLDWSSSLRSFICCSSCCLRKLGSIQKWISWEWSPYCSQRCDSHCENTPAWGLYNLVEGSWHYLEDLKLRSGCSAKRICEETSGSKIYGISSLHVYNLYNAQVSICETCWVCPRTSLPLICLPCNPA